MAKELVLTGKITISNFDGKVQFFFDKLDPKGPSDTNPSGVIEYSNNIGLEIWQKFKNQVVEVTVVPVVDWSKDQ